MTQQPRVQIECCSTVVSRLRRDADGRWGDYLIIADIKERRAHPDDPQSQQQSLAAQLLRDDDTPLRPRHNGHGYARVRFRFCCALCGCTLPIRPEVLTYYLDRIVAATLTPSAIRSVPLRPLAAIVSSAGDSDPEPRWLQPDPPARC